MPSASGSRIHGRYELAERLGSGGSARVYRARDLLFGTDVALKVVPLEGGEPPATFVQEFSALRGLFHPRLARVHDFGRATVEETAVAFYTSDVVDGVPLGRHARGRAWSGVQPALADGLCALAFLHRGGLRHGDFKPDNLLVARDGRGTLIDLGCAAAPPPGTVSGTPGYLAPELLAGAAPDLRADLYAVGVTLGELAALARRVPARVTALAARLTRERPAERPADVDEILAALGEAAESGEPLAPPCPLFEREEAVGAAARLLDALHAGAPAPRALGLVGPDGIGRTRALAECKWLAQPRGLVVEGDARRSDAIHDLLRRASGDPALPDDLGGVVAGRRRLAAAPEPVVLVLDDADRLEPSQGRAFETLLRLLDPAGPLAVLWTGRAPVAVPAEVAVVVELRPLGEASVRRMVGSRLPAGKLSDFVRLTGGVPAEVRALLALVRSGAEDLRGLAAAVPADERHVAGLRALDEGARRLLGLCAAAGGYLEPDAAVALGVPDSALHELLARGRLLPDGSGFRLARLGDAAAVERLLGAEALTGLHAALADRLAGRPERRAERVRHLVLAERLDEAQQKLADAAPERLAQPEAWRSAADALAAARPEPSVLLAAAELHESAGDPRRALELAAPLLELELAPAERTAVLFRVGSCHLKLGDAQPTLRYLLQALERERDAAARARTADLLCRAYVQQGAYEQAAQLAEQQLARGPADVAAELHEDLGVALSYLGRADEARRQLGTAERLAVEGGLPRAAVRTLSYRGILEYRLGDVPAAAEHHARALGLAERHGLVDQAASAALNLGTALHRLADWGAALEAYERGLEPAVALGKLRTEVALRFDLAQLYCDLGRFERAEQFLAQSRERAVRGELGFFVAAAELLAGEILLWQGRLPEARERLVGAREALRAHGTPREVADAELHLAELELADGAPDEADARLAAADVAATTSDAEDLRTRVRLLRGRVELERGRPSRALASFEQAVPRAAASGERDLEAELESWLAAACERQGADHAARRHRDRALELWERCAAALPAHLRDGVWLHPRRAALQRGAPPEPAVAAGPSSRERKLARLVALNARLNSSLDAQKVLELTMDAAVELTGAERGFLLLAPQQGEAKSKLRVAIARNIDREAVGKASMKFSRSIAERVLATGEPVLTAEALADDRFARKRSVQAMGLVAVLGVPIRGRDGVLGALYVDNRFQRGRFGSEDLEILLGLADQVGIALTNARLLAELDARTRQLEAERKRISASLADRSREVEQLTEQVRLTQRALSHRYDYSGIVGRGPAMQAVFAVLDRVTPSRLGVLIEGESGTGKELVARAIHYNGPRREAPFVGVNCGALSETLLESELFGHVRGAFTGADRDRVGLFVHAADGTLFLDEVGEMPPSMQVKLLRALEEGEVRPVGASETRRAAPRIVCATNRRLTEEVEAGRFREDLYYRIAVVRVVVPPLRERVEDLPDLARHLLERLAAEAGRPPATLSVEALRRLLAYDWPGNVRQLENVLSQALVFATDRTIGADEVLLPAAARGPRREAHREFQAREAAELAAALDASRWNIVAVARTLGIPRTSLYRKLRRYGLTRKG
ncbi:MAG: sigma 54-interacting transcriptional regulator [Deltaproteobacteria bacterium]|nr:sigma 54-interacting transcriptional regulator [Deltaproteobacteria bacterium]